jgi:cytoskeletal protein RodZ
MQTLGQQLRAEREKKGLSIPDLSTRTRIGAHLFEAIEADKPEQFPGRFFYRSFLRQYAEMLELPESVVHPEIERSLTEEQAEIAQREVMAQGFRPEVPPLPTGRINVREETRRWMIRLSGLLGVLILCSLVYFFWQRWGQRMFDDSWRAVVTRPAKPASKPKPSAQPAVPPSVASQSPGQPASTTATPLTPAETTPQPPAGQPDAKVNVPPPGVPPQGMIEIRATGYCWVGGWRDGTRFLNYTMHPGEVRTVEGGGALRIQFSNSGNVAIKVDGGALKQIGAKGEPRTLEYHDGTYRLLNSISAVRAKP